MSDITADFSDGNPLTASELNNWKDEREGTLLPIDGTTKNYVDDTYSVGSASYRFKNGNFSGVLRADGQPQVRVYQTSAGLGTLISDASWTTVTWEAENFDEGSMWTTPNDYLLVPESGTYMIYGKLRMDVAPTNGDMIGLRLINNSTTVAEKHTYYPDSSVQVTYQDADISTIEQLSQNDQITMDAKIILGSTPNRCIVGREMTYLYAVKLF